MAEWEEHRQSPGWSNWAWHSVFVIEHRQGRPELSSVQQMLAQAKESFREYRRGSLCLILGEEARPPDGSAREAFEEFFRQNPDVDVGIWIRTAGVWGSAIRSVATGIFKIRLPSVRSTIFARREDCVRWIAERVDSSEDAAGAFVDEMLKAEHINID